MKTNKIWTIGLVGGAVIIGIGLSARPWQVYAEQKVRTADYQKRMREAEQRRVDLTKEKARAEGPLGREQAARDMGFTKPGEQAVR